MANPMLHEGFTCMCPHGGQAQAIAASKRVKASGQAVVTMSDNFPISACPFTVPVAKPQPCIKIQWIVPATRVFIEKKPVLTTTSTGLCLSPEQIPQGAPNIVVTQVRAKAT